METPASAVSSFSDFLALVRKFVENTSLEIKPTSLVGDVFYDELAKEEFAELIERSAGEIFTDDSATLKSMYAHVYGKEATTTEDNLIFQRLLHGVDVSRM